MRIIAQKSDTLNTYDFFYNGLTKKYINSLCFSITYTKDNKIVIFNTPSAGYAITNTINNSTFDELQGYEIILLDDVLKALNKNNIKKDLYINLTPSNPGLLTEDNIKQVNQIMNDYVEKVKTIINSYTNLNIHLHSVSRNLITILKQKINTYKIGFAVTGEDATYIDVDYYVLTSNTQNDSIIDTLLKNNKEVIIYVYSDYYMSYLYEHYLGEKSTPYLQQTFEKLALLTNYPEIINRIFNS